MLESLRICFGGVIDIVKSFGVEGYWQVDTITSIVNRLLIWAQIGTHERRTPNGVNQCKNAVNGMYLRSQRTSGGSDGPHSDLRTLRGFSGKCKLPVPASSAVECGPLSVHSQTMEARTFLMLSNTSCDQWLSVAKSDPCGSRASRWPGRPKRFRDVTVTFHVTERGNGTRDTVTCAGINVAPTDIQKAFFFYVLEILESPAGFGSQHR